MIKTRKEGARGGQALIKTQINKPKVNMRICKQYKIIKSQIKPRTEFRRELNKQSYLPRQAFTKQIIKSNNLGKSKENNRKEEKENNDLKTNIKKANNTNIQTRKQGNKQTNKRAVSFKDSVMNKLQSQDDTSNVGANTIYNAKIWIDKGGKISGLVVRNAKNFSKKNRNLNHALKNVSNKGKNRNLNYVLKNVGNTGKNISRNSKDSLINNLKSQDDTTNTGANAVYEALEYKDKAVSAVKSANKAIKTIKKGIDKTEKTKKVHQIKTTNRTIKRTTSHSQSKSSLQKTPGKRPGKSSVKKNGNVSKNSVSRIKTNNVKKKSQKAKINRVKDTITNLYKKGKSIIKSLFTTKALIIGGVVLFLLFIISSISSTSTTAFAPVNAIFADTKTITNYKDAFEQIKKEHLEKIEQYKNDRSYDEVIIKPMNEGGALTSGWKEILILMTVKYEQELPTNPNPDLRELFNRFNKLDTQEETYTVIERKNGKDKEKTKKRLTVRVFIADIETVMNELKFNDDQKEWARQLQNADFKELFPEIDFGDTFGGSPNTNTLTPEEIAELMKDVPPTNIGRQKLIETALSLVGKVKYFWGGKSQAGWNSNWGQPALVTAPGSDTSGTVIPYGLDCSGFVDWAYKTAGLGDVLSAGGTYYQWSNSYPISESDLKPGDLVFNADCSHVGLFLSRDSNGNKQFVHCASQSGVTINCWDGFTVYRRPFVKFQGESEVKK